MTDRKVYSFDNKYSSNHPFGKFVSNEFDPRSKWEAFSPKKGGFFVFEDILFVINDNKMFTVWNSNGDINKENEPIIDADLTFNLNGASVLLPDNKIAIVIKHQVN